MDDQQILSEITALVEEEDTLRRRHEAALDDTERTRVEQIEIALDQCWDLLRQRRARREFDSDPDAAKVRGVETVERYQQ